MYAVCNFPFALVVKAVNAKTRFESGTQYSSRENVNRHERNSYHADCTRVTRRVNWLVTEPLDPRSMKPRNSRMKNSPGRGVIKGETSKFMVPECGKKKMATFCPLNRIPVADRLT